uniref:TPR_REGION domain-containing protein n=1 Tax=Parastrongyloides trichosuri TaxID=131310 RepID=A0A0N4ZP37_PARTI
MSLNKALVEPECGGPNSLVGLSQNVVQNNSKLQNQRNNAINSLLPSLSKGEDFVQEYMSSIHNVPSSMNSFDMRSLIGAIPQEPNNRYAKEWTNEFLSESRNPDMNNIWNKSIQQVQTSKPTTHIMSWVNSYNNSSLVGQNNVQNTEGHSEMWSSEYLDKFDKFDKKSDNLANNWYNEFLNKNESTTNSIYSDTINTIKTTDEDYENEWDSIIDNNPYFSQLGEDETKYEFQDNPYINVENPSDIAKTLMTNGNLSDAILYYEVAVQQKPDDSNAWCALGLCHAENEDDINAIKAFNKSLILNPSNKEALLGYSVSLSNEFRENEAVEYLEKWLQAHLNQNVEPLTNVQTYRSTFLNRIKFDKVEKDFLDVARRNSGKVDVELQNALGILYNIGNNFSRAIDSLKLAVANKPDDPRLWNRLGATFANDDKTTDAINAYRQALSLFPTYVRARYNLGISCMHLNSYEQAVEHLVSAIELQKNEKTSLVWNTLRTAVIRLPKLSPGVMESIDNRDLYSFKKLMNL